MTVFRMQDKCPMAASPQTPLCRLDEIAEGEPSAVEATLPEGTESLILLRRGGSVCAWRNVCPHAGRRLDWAPGQFLRSGDTLICAAHGASFRLADGLCIGGPCRGQQLQAVPVRVADGAVWLDG